MASIYRRPPESRTGVYWIAFNHPRSGDLVRRSLETNDTAKATRISRHVEALCRSASASAPILPESIRTILLSEASSSQVENIQHSTGGGILSPETVLPLLEVQPKMPSIYPRPTDATNPIYWVALYHPVTGQPIRKSLETRNKAEAQRKVDRIEALCGMISTQDIEIPLAVVDAIGAREMGTVPGSSVQNSSLNISVVATPPRCTIECVLRSLMKNMLLGNDGHYFDNVLSYSRRLFGSFLVERIDPRPPVVRKNTEPDKRKAPFREPGIMATFLDEITGEKMADFMKNQGFGMDSCRHYKEFVRRLFNHAIESGLHIPANPFAPNPMKSLPGFVDTERDIIVLSIDDELKQLTAIANDWRISAGIRILLGTGMRLHEMLSVRVADVLLDKGYLRLLRNNLATNPKKLGGTLDLNLPQKRKAESIAAPRAIRKNSTLKRGERPVALMPELLDFMPSHLKQLEIEGYEWLIPSPQGMRWNAGNFGKQLHELNVAAQLDFTAANMRRTYATRRLSENWPLSVLARQMGTSIKMLELHYGAYIPPQALKYCQSTRVTAKVLPE